MAHREYRLLTQMRPLSLLSSLTVCLAARCLVCLAARRRPRTRAPPPPSSSSDRIAPSLHGMYPSASARSRVAAHGSAPCCSASRRSRRARRASRTRTAGVAAARGSGGSTTRCPSRCGASTSCRAPSTRWTFRWSARRRSRRGGGVPNDAPARRASMAVAAMQAAGWLAVAADRHECSWLRLGKGPTSTLTHARSPIGFFLNNFFNRISHAANSEVRFACPMRTHRQLGLVVRCGDLAL